MAGSLGEDDAEGLSSRGMNEEMGGFEQSSKQSRTGFCGLVDESVQVHPEWQLKCSVGRRSHNVEFGRQAPLVQESGHFDRSPTALPAPVDAHEEKPTAFRWTAPDDIDNIVTEV